MKQIAQSSAFASLFALAATSASAQAVRTEKNMSLDLANQIAAATVAACTANGYAVLVHIPGFLLLGGGVPVKVGNDTIGAVGVGGAPGGHLDEQCALAALDKVKGLLQ